MTIARGWTRVLAGTLLVFLYARGGPGWLLGFVAFVPWLRALDTQRTFGGTLLFAWAMSVAYTAVVFPWFASAIGSYTRIGTAGGMAVLLLAAPLFQPQFLAFAAVRHIAAHHHGPLLSAVAASSAWVATEWFVPRLLGDTWGYGLYPSRTLRQAADTVGVTGLTFLLLLANEAVAAALASRRNGLRAVALPLAGAALVVLLLAGYGAHTLRITPPSEESLRIGLVQSNITDYERLRRERGTGAVVREVLDTHFAMSYDAIERQRADAVLWSETVYPTTFGRPKSDAGAEFDREILEVVDAAGVPFVFGTYERDAAGEYNAAAFVSPGRGLEGFYRKARPFPVTEYVPPWLDGPLFRAWFPWAGTWQPGSGARVLPLRLRGGREVPVLPLICLDDVDSQLAIDGARLGARAILTMSNDAWFSAQPLGAEWHQAAAAFRSIETRLPQFRVTTSGYSALIDATGTVVADTHMGERTLVIGALPVGEPPRTLMVAWGDWVGRAAAGVLLVLAAVAALRRVVPSTVPPCTGGPPPAARPEGLPPAARWLVAALRVFARAVLLWMAGAVVFGDDGLAASPVFQIRIFMFLVVAPELAAWLVLRAFHADPAPGRGLRHPVAKFVLLPLVLAVPAFRLHQHIAYGSSFGELQAFGALAFAKGFGLWLATWMVIVAMWAAVVRAVVEVAARSAAFMRPQSSARVRHALERAGLAALYLGLPAALLFRILG